MIVNFGITFHIIFYVTMVVKSNISSCVHCVFISPLLFSRIVMIFYCVVNALSFKIKSSIIKASLLIVSWGKAYFQALT